jgi:hypothetical protein
MSLCFRQPPASSTQQRSACHQRTLELKVIGNIALPEVSSARSMRARVEWEALGERITNISFLSHMHGIARHTWEVVVFDSCLMRMLALQRRQRRLSA